MAARGVRGAGRGVGATHGHHDGARGAERVAESGATGARPQACATAVVVARRDGRRGAHGAGVDGQPQVLAVPRGHEGAHVHAVRACILLEVRGAVVFVEEHMSNMSAPCSSAETGLSVSVLKIYEMKSVSNYITLQYSCHHLHGDGSERWKDYTL